MNDQCARRGGEVEEVWHSGTVCILAEITSQYEETMAEWSRDHTYGGGGGSSQVCKEGCLNPQAV